MDILRGYGLGPKLQRLLQRYWDGQKVVPKAGFFRVSFQHRERSGIGGPVIPDYLQHSSGRSSKGGPPGSLRTPGGTSWVWLISK